MFYKYICVYMVSVANESFISFRAETSTLAQNELCVTKLKKTLKRDAPVVNCVRGFVGGCPSYEWV